MLVMVPATPSRWSPHWCARSLPRAAGGRLGAAGERWSRYAPRLQDAAGLLEDASIDLLASTAFPSISG